MSHSSQSLGNTAFYYIDFPHIIVYSLHIISQFTFLVLVLISWLSKNAIKIFSLEIYTVSIYLYDVSIIMHSSHERL